MHERATSGMAATGMTMDKGRAYAGDVQSGLQHRDQIYAEKAAVERAQSRLNTAPASPRESLLSEVAGRLSSMISIVNVTNENLVELRLRIFGEGEAGVCGPKADSHPGSALGQIGMLLVELEERLATNAAHVQSLRRLA